MIVALGVRRRGGRAAIQALTHVIEEWKGEVVATIDPEEFYDFTVRRPDTVRTETRHDIEWPQPQIFLARPEGSNRDFLMLLGFEPHFHWKRFVQEVTDYMVATGVRTLIVVRSFPANVPHTRPASVMLTATNAELEALFGITESAERYEGEADIGSVLSAKAESLDCNVLDISLLQPFYYPRMPNAVLSLSLAGMLDRAFGTSTPDATLREAARSQMEAIDEIVAGDESMRSLVADLEKQYDEGRNTAGIFDPLAEPPAETPAALPTGEELIQDIERLLREQRNPES
jgi:hypothetical protein